LFLGIRESCAFRLAGSPSLETQLLAGSLSLETLLLAGSPSLQTLLREELSLLPPLLPCEVCHDGSHQAAAEPSTSRHGFAPDR